MTTILELHRHIHRGGIPTDMREGHRHRRITHHMGILKLHIHHLPTMDHLTLAIKGLYLVPLSVVTQCNTLGAQTLMRNRRHKDRYINQGLSGQERNHRAKIYLLTRLK